MEHPVQYDQYGVPAGDTSKRKRRANLVQEKLSALFFPRVFSAWTMFAILAQAYLESSAIAVYYAPIANAVFVLVGLLLVDYGLPIKAKDLQPVVIVLCGILSSAVILVATFAGFHGC